MSVNPQIRLKIGNLSLSFLIIIVIIFIINNVTFSQGRRDRPNTSYNYNKVNTSDSTQQTTGDSLTSIDSTRLAPVDSTSRIRYFKYVPEYTYGTQIKPKTSPLLLDNSEKITSSIDFDTSGNVIIREQLDGKDIKAPLVIPLDEYIKQMTQNNDSKAFSNLMDTKYTGNTQDDLSQLFNKFTDITIPLPFKSESIFGPPTLNLKINGAVDITASYQNATSDQTLISGLSSSNNSINFKQEVQLTAKGKVGDKLTIDADYNTQRLFDFENQLKIKYEGYADEVIKKLEGGNVSLETRSGLIGSSQALFGIRGDFQLGALSLSTVLSQKKSKTEVKDFTNGAQEQTFQIKVYDYSDNHYLLDTAYKQSFLNYYNNTTIDSVTNQLIVDDQSFQIWVQTDYTNRDKRKANLFTDLGPLPPSGRYPDSLLRIDTLVQGLSSTAWVRRLPASEYTLNKYAGYISLKISIPESYVIGVAYKQTNTLRQYGTISTDDSVSSADTLILKMIKVENLVPSNTLAWDLKLKNIYRLPVSRIVQEGFEFNVQYLTNGVYQPTLPPSQNISANLITVLGLDKYTNGRWGGPDNKFDWIPGVTIDPENGFVIFPDLKPFLNNLKEYQGQPIDSSLQYPQIYTQLKTSADDQPNGVNYIISGKARGESSVSNTLNLGFNIVQGSVVVKVGELVLGVNSDYTMDYTTGTLVIKNNSALLSKDLKISYETNDLFTLASKTFMGVRGDYKISDKSALGFTFVNLNQETLNEKVRIGEEPTNNAMYGIDFTTDVPSKFLTNIVNLLPGYNTKEQSLITLRGELAAISPDPNTNKSQIPQDNNEAVAYIDDMEGVKKNISIGINYSTWSIASPPLGALLGSSDNLLNVNKRRGKAKWFNVANSVNLTTIYPNKDVQPSQNSVTPFYFIYVPQKRGIYNYNGSYVDSVDKRTSWNGMMKYLNTTNNDLVSENINFIEFSMRVAGINDQTRFGKLVIDMGSIQQDVILNGIVDTEDSLKNGDMRAREDDKGMDFLTDSQERELYTLLNGQPPPPNEFGDPALDNNDSLGAINYEIINGTQNNFEFENGRRPDTEDLNKTNNVRNPNDYYQFEIDLDPENNPYIVGSGAPGSGWFQYKIPLSEYTNSYGNATFSNIRFVRMWIKNVTDSVELTMYDLNLTGNQWVKPNKLDTTYNVTAVSIEENSQVYNSPGPDPNALRQTIRGQNNVETQSNEQSLSMEVFNLTNGMRKVARKDLSTIPVNLFNYRQIKMFVNGDPSFNYTDEQIYDAAMVVRLGNDSNNYYEYRAPIHPDIRNPAANPNYVWNNFNNITINIEDLTQLKLARDSANIPYTTDTTNGPPGSQFKVLGNPDLQSIREIVIGIEKNRNSINASISGSVWFDELRVINAIDDAGFAYNVNANFKFADLLDLNFGLSNVNPYFHAIDGRIGTLTSATNWDFSATLNLHKFINNAFSSFLSESWSNFINLPITYRHSEALVNPNYFPGTDVEINDAADVTYNKVLNLTGNPELANAARNNVYIEAQSLTVRNSLSISNMSFNLPGNNFFVKSIFNQLRFNFNTEFGNARDITYENKDDFRYNGGISFATDFGLSKDLSLNIGNLLPMGEKYTNAKMYFFFPFIPLAPLFSSNFSASTDFNRSQSESKQRRFLNDDFTTRLFTANRGFRFDWKFLENWIVDINGNYDFSVGSDLTPYTTAVDSTSRSEGQIFNDIFFNNGVVNFGEDLNYVQSVTINPRFNFPYVDRFLAFNGNYNVRYGWLNPNLNTNVGFSVGFQNQISTSAVIKLKEIFSLFQGGSSTESKLQANGVSRDSTTQESGNKQSIGDLLKLFGTFVPTDINVTYTQSNQVANGGVNGLPGFGNFWFYPTTQENLGPSRLYQMGFSLYPGTRAPNLEQINDIYAQGNDLSFTATINPIFPEALSMQLKFSTNWNFSNSLNYRSNSQGNIGAPTSKTSTMSNGNTMFFAGNIEEFSFGYQQNNASQNRNNITTAFEEQMASIPFPNWSLTVSGLEKIPLFAEFANVVTLDNSFTSEYKESTLIDIGGSNIPNAQSVTQAFSPLIGLNFNFKEVMGGNLISTFRLNTGRAYLLNPAGANIQSTTTSEWSINANFARAGFNIPLFGLALQNDISFALTLSKIINEPVNYEYATTGTGIAVPGNGSSVTTINPSIQYSLSSKVSMQLFYKYIKTQPSQNASVSTVPRTSNEGGLNIRIAIQ